MKVLQIWLNKPLSSNLQKNMKTVLSKLEDGDSYILISDKQYFKNNQMVTWINLKAIYESINKEYNSIVDKIINEKLDVRYLSDLIRFWFLANNSNVFYLDCDGILNKKPNLTNIPAFYHYLTAKNIRVDINAMWNGSNQKFFLEVLNEVITTNQNIKSMSMRFHMVLNSMLTNLEKYDLIYNDTYIHGIK